MRKQEVLNLRRRVSKRLWGLLFLGIAAVYLAGCAVALPVHQLHTPQSRGSLNFEFGAMSNTAPSIGPDYEDGSSLDNNTVDSLAEAVPSMGAAFGLGITESLDIELEAIANFGSGSIASAGIKYQWLGSNIFSGKAGSMNSSVRVKYFVASGYEDDATNSSSDNIFNGIFTEKLEGSGLIVSNSFGYLLADFFGAYVGGQYIQGSLKYDYREGSSTGTLYSGDRSFTGYGPFAGLHLNSSGTSFRAYLAMEVQYTNLPATFSDERVWHESVATYLGLILNL